MIDNIRKIKIFKIFSLKKKKRGKKIWKGILLAKTKK